MPEHPDSLSKYCSASTALEILETGALRWSAPNLYADPFELNHRTSLGFDPHSLLEHVIRAACGMIFAREEPRGSSPLATVIRRWRGEERFASPEEAEEVLGELMARMVDQRQGEIDALMADWRQYTRQLRLCSFSAKPDNLTCWQYFADCHRGAVLRFACGEDTSLGVPVAMKYNLARPEITTLKDELNAVLYQERTDSRPYFQEKFLSKPTLAKNEQEWRCFHTALHEDSSRQADDKLWYDDHPFAAPELSSVYLGAYLAVEDKRAIAEQVTQHYPATKLFQAEAVPGKYEIAFSRFTLPKKS